MFLPATPQQQHFLEEASEEGYAKGSDLQGLLSSPTSPRCGLKAAASDEIPRRSAHWEGAAFAGGVCVCVEPLWLVGQRNWHPFLQARAQREWSALQLFEGIYCFLFRFNSLSHFNFKAAFLVFMEIRFPPFSFISLSTRRWQKITRSTILVSWTSTALKYFR